MVDDEEMSDSEEFRRTDRWLPGDMDVDYFAAQRRRRDGVHPVRKPDDPLPPPRTPPAVDHQLHYDELRRTAAIHDRHLPFGGEKHTSDCFCRPRPPTPEPKPAPVEPNRILGWYGAGVSGFGCHAGFYGAGAPAAGFSCPFYNMEPPKSPPPRRDPLTNRGPLRFNYQELKDGGFV